MFCYLTFNSIYGVNRCEFFPCTSYLSKLCNKEGKCFILLQLHLILGRRYARTEKNNIVRCKPLYLSHLQGQYTGKKGYIYTRMYSIIIKLRVIVLVQAMSFPYYTILVSNMQKQRKYNGLHPNFSYKNHLIYYYIYDVKKTVLFLQVRTVSLSNKVKLYYYKPCPFLITRFW